MKRPCTKYYLGGQGTCGLREPRSQILTLRRKAHQTTGKLFLFFVIFLTISLFVAEFFFVEDEISYLMYIYIFFKFGNNVRQKMYFELLSFLLVCFDTMILICIFKILIFYICSG